ncbi:MAG: cobaltochelatase subunit CobN, partial [Hyphomicrobiales bacterium]|nr:cobaltochelatase subunit CobN [Hyphomicrobiales bacterium]
MHIVTSKSHQSKNHEKTLNRSQDSADIIFLSSADTEISLLSKSVRRVSKYPSIRLTNVLNLAEHKSIDAYISKTVSKAKIVIIRILGGKSYWNYGVDKLVEDQIKKKYEIIFFPGDDKFDEQLYALSSINGSQYKELWSYFIEGGSENAINLLKYITYLKFNTKKPSSSKRISPVGIYWPNKNEVNSSELEKNWDIKKKGIICITFYSALLQSGQTEVIDSLISELQKNYNCLPIYAKSFKDKTNAELTTYLLKKYAPISLINLTGFSLKQDSSNNTTVFDGGLRIVFQAILSSMSEHEWSHSHKGMNNRDIIMSVSLPEIDGRLITKTIAFKEKVRFDSLTQTDLLEYQPNKFGIEYLCGLIKNWADLHTLKNSEKKIFISLANYPNKDSRIANGVGLDTPSSVINLINKFKKKDYFIKDFPKSSHKLMKQLIAGQTNNLNKKISIDIKSIKIKDYKKFYNKLSKKVRDEVEERWGPVENDPFVKNGLLLLPIQNFGNISIGIQPSRGYNIDPKSTYHSPDLVPPHYYFGYYFWLKHIFKANALIQFGKHGNLEWLPGKSLSLSKNCYPEAILESTPLIYPFIVNDPGEGTQAKRRNAAIIVDHLTPSLTRADTYGDLIEIELLLDEYYDAYQTDGKRADNIKHQILELTQSIGLYTDTMIEKDDNTETKLNKIDTYLCELKELQIRDGLHIFGKSPRNNELYNLLLSIAKISRKDGLNQNQPITQAIADDMSLNFNAINCIRSESYKGPKKNILADLSQSAWRSNSDTIERLELLSENILKDEYQIPKKWLKTKSVINSINQELKPSIQKSG